MHQQGEAPYNDRSACLIPDNTRPEQMVRISHPAHTRAKQVMDRVFFLSYLTEEAGTAMK